MKPLAESRSDGAGTFNTTIGRSVRVVACLGI